MPTRLINVIVDSADPVRQTRFWSELLGWPVSYQDEHEIDLRSPTTDGWEWDFVFLPVPDPKTVKNRVHLDLAGPEPEALVARALSLGAAHADIGQGPTPWSALRDPEGNEFCVLDPRPEYRDTGPVAAVVVDALDPGAQAKFWAAATGWPVARETPDLAALRSPDGRGPWLEFVRVSEPKSVKNRLHLDVAGYPDDDQQVEVDRLISLGARMGPSAGDFPWRVMRDPEDNEFCVLTSRAEP